MKNFIVKIIAIILSITTILALDSEETKLSNSDKNLRFLVGEFICPSGRFGISWYSTYLTGKKLSKYTNTNSICLDSSTGIAHYNEDYNLLTCYMYRSACGGPKTSNLKSSICQAFSKYEKNTVGPDRIIYSEHETPDEKTISEHGSSIKIVVADFGNSGNLKKFYDSLPNECKKHLNLTFDI